MVVTQPRRIAAIALAERVAAERGERVGGSVGYQVKGDAKRGASTRLLYCTTGVLLRRLQSDAHMRGVSHVVIDEVHERGIDSDFLLIILKAALASNPTLRVVLMSATVDAERFAGYFGGPKATSTLMIPGRTFPIDDFFLEDAIERSGYVARGKTLLRGAEAEAELGALEENEGEATEEAAAARATEVAKEAGSYSERTRQALCKMPAEAAKGDLVAALLATSTPRRTRRRRRARRCRSAPCSSFCRDWRKSDGWRQS